MRPSVRDLTRAYESMGTNAVATVAAWRETPIVTEAVGTMVSFGATTVGAASNPIITTEAPGSVVSFGNTWRALAGASILVHKLEKDGDQIRGWGLSAYSSLWPTDPTAPDPIAPDPIAPDPIVSAPIVSAPIPRPQSLTIASPRDSPTPPTAPIQYGGGGGGGGWEERSEGTGLIPVGILLAFLYLSMSDS
jgi:hypothetical protein